MDYPFIVVIFCSLIQKVKTDAFSKFGCNIPGLVVPIIPWYRVAANRETTESRVPSVKEVNTSQVL